MNIVILIIIIVLLIWLIYYLNQESNTNTNTNINLQEESLNDFNCSLSQYRKDKKKMGLFVLNIKTGENMYSDELKKIYGVNAKNNIDLSHFFSLVYPEDKKRVQDSLKKAIASGNYRTSFRIKTLDNKTKYLAACGRVLYDSNKPILLVGYNIDMTPKN